MKREKSVLLLRQNLLIEGLWKVQNRGDKFARCKELLYDSNIPFRIYLQYLHVFFKEFIGKPSLLIQPWMIEYIVH